MKMQQLKVENVILIFAAETNTRGFQTVLLVHEVRFLFRKPLSTFLSTISSLKKLYRIQPAEFFITELIFRKIRPEFLNIEFF